MIKKNWKSGRGNLFLLAIQVSIIALLITTYAVAQIGDTGQIQGTVTDTSGAAVPGATVTATAVATNRTSNTATNDEGTYVFPSLPIGQYTIQVEMQGFRASLHSGITLSVQQVAVVNVRLEVGAVSERVQVTAAAPLLDTQQANQGQVIDSKRIVGLPLNGRDYVQLALLSEGTVAPVANSRFGGFSANGQRVAENNYMVNGLDNNEMEIAAQGLQAEVVKPIVDAVEEFKVQTNGYSAEFGKAAGGVLNLRTRSGTNQFRGSAWEFFRNEKLDARDFFNRALQPKAPFKRNQFGGTIGGPLIHNKLFFFEALEFQRRRESASEVSTLPTMKMRQGDLSELSKPIFDPATFDPATGTRQPFPGNIIPADRIDPVARQVVALIPPAQNGNLSRNFTFVSPRGFDSFKDDARFDYSYREKDNFAWTFDWNQQEDLPAPAFPGPLGGRLNRTAITFHGILTSVQWSHVFTPAFIAVTKVGWNRRYTDNQPAISQNLNGQIGLRGVNQVNPGIAQFNVTGLSTLGGVAFTPNLTQSQNRELVSDLTALKSKHQFKFGFSVQWLQSFLTNPQQAIGDFSFNGNFTRNPKGNLGGNGFADFLLGIPVNATVTTGVFMNLRTRYHGAYVQDTWKLTPKLTLNYGLRYELFLPWVDKKNGLANFDPNLINAPRVTLIVAQNGPSRVSRSLIAAETKDFAPRFGLAYDVGHNTVVRAAYGIFYGTLEPSGGGQFLETNLPFKFSSLITTDNINPAFTLAQGVPNVLTPKNAASPVLSSFQRDFDFLYSQQWNFNIQHTFARDWLFQIGYFGSAAHHLPLRLDLNQPPPGPGNINARRPFKSVIFPGTDLVISPLAGFNSHEFTGNNSYNSLQAKVEKRFSGGFTLLSSYLFSRNIGDTCGLDTASGSAPGCAVQNVHNLRAERGLESEQQKHRFVASYLYDLPFGRGRYFGRSWNRAIDAVLGGWSTMGMITYASGLPFTITSAGDPANVGGPNTSVRANLVGNPARPAGVDMLDEFFNTAAFAPSAPFTFGNLGRNTLTGPGLTDWDFGMFKLFSITEKVNTEFRFEAFNFTNTPNFGMPGNVVGTPNFGEISSSGLGRKLQFALKISF